MRWTLPLLALAAACGDGDVDAIIRQAGWQDSTTSTAGSLAIDGADVVYNAYGIVNYGTLTEDAVTEGQDIAGALIGEELGTTYCGDGCELTSSISIVRESNEDTITYPMGEPPPFLVDADGFVNNIMNDLAQCVNSADVTPAGDCLRMF